MTRSTHSCPACGIATCSPAIEFSEFPAFLFPMRKSKASSVEAPNLTLYLCQNCGHIFQANVDRSLLSLIYEKYYSDYLCDSNEALSLVYRQPFNSFFDLMQGTKAKKITPTLLEIGCSRPANMIPFAHKGWFCIGIDPSPLADTALNLENIAIVSGYYEETIVPNPADTIVSRFNLEHIIDLSAHLQKIRTDLVEGGRVLVQVPNVAYYLENNQPLFVAHEHIHYFSEKSLVCLFERFGFCTIATYSSGQPSILACFESNSSEHTRSTPVNKLVGSYKNNVALKAEDLALHLQVFKRVVFYGCGLALYWALSVLRDQLPANVTIVDDNPAIDGKALPFYGFTVCQPTRQLLADADLIILTLNPIYHDLVISKLESQHLSVKVLKIGRDRLELLML